MNNFSHQREPVRLARSNNKIYIAGEIVLVHWDCTGTIDAHFGCLLFFVYSNSPAEKQATQIDRSNPPIQACAVRTINNAGDSASQTPKSAPRCLAFRLIQMPGEAKVHPRSYLIYERREYAGTQYWGSVSTKPVTSSLAFNALSRFRR